MKNLNDTNIKKTNARIRWKFFMWIEVITLIVYAILFHKGIVEYADAFFIFAIVIFNTIMFNPDGKDFSKPTSLRDRNILGFRRK